MKKLTIFVGMLFTLTCGCGSEERGAAEPGDPCENTIDCTPGSICYSLVCVGEGPLRFSMSWTEDTDIDLHVMTPAGNEIYFLDPVNDAGLLDVDDCALVCAMPGVVHVENVFFTDAAARGTYKFWIENFSEEIDAEVKIEGFVNGAPTSYTETVTMAAPMGAIHQLTY